MHSFGARFIPVSVALLFVLAAGGCKKEQEEQTRTVKIRCGDQTVDVDPNIGANPPSVYVCDDDKVTWNANGHKFNVEFKQDSPFSDNDKVFHNGHPQSHGAKHLKVWTVFPYTITVDGKVFDPQVIGGGGNNSR